jgi:hypothetical protein
MAVLDTTPGGEMRSTYRVLAYALAAEVVLQAMFIAYALAAMGHWVDEDNGVVNKALFDADEPDFPGVGGFMLHGMNGMMLIPLIALVLLVVSFFAKVQDGTKRAAILLGMVVLQVVLGVSGHSVPALAPVHALNAFGIAAMAFMTARRVGTAAPETVTV